jgi:hypothetical protein
MIGLYVDKSIFVSRSSFQAYGIKLTIRQHHQYSVIVLGYCGSRTTAVYCTVRQ